MTFNCVTKQQLQPCFKIYIFLWCIIYNINIINNITMDISRIRA